MVIGVAAPPQGSPRNAASASKSISWNRDCPHNTSLATNEKGPLLVHNKLLSLMPHPVEIVAGCSSHGLMAERILTTGQGRNTAACKLLRDPTRVPDRVAPIETKPA